MEISRDLRCIYHWPKYHSMGVCFSVYFGSYFSVIFSFIVLQFILLCADIDFVLLIFVFLGLFCKGNCKTEAKKQRKNNG